MKEPSSKLSLYREKWSKTESHFTNKFVNISPLESPPGSTISVKVVRLLSRYRIMSGNNFLFLLGWYREKSRPFVDRAFLFCLKRRSERYVRTVTDAEK